MNTSRQVTVRTARGDTADAREVAWALETATDRMFSMMIGRTWQTTLADLVLVPGHAWSWPQARIAEVDGETQGVALSGPADLPAPDDSLGLGWGWRRIRLSAVALAGHPFLSFMEHHEPGEWYLTAIAVRPKARGLGIGSRLLYEVIERGTAAQKSSVTLDVDAKNTGASRLYGECGFTVSGSSGRAWLMGGVVVRRMRRLLTDPPVL